MKGAQDDRIDDVYDMLKNMLNGQAEVTGELKKMNTHIESMESKLDQKLAVLEKRVETNTTELRNELGSEKARLHCKNFPLKLRGISVKCYSLSP